MNTTLRAYLELERLMRYLDYRGDPAADALRDAMDPLWYRLTNEERELLNRRSIGTIEAIGEIRLPFDENLYISPPGPPPRKPIPRTNISNWREVA